MHISVAFFFCIGVGIISTFSSFLINKAQEVIKYAVPGADRLDMSACDVGREKMSYVRSLQTKRPWNLALGRNLKKNA